MRAYSPSKFHVCSVSGSRDSRGQNIPPPSRARNSQTLSRGRVKTFDAQLKTIDRRVKINDKQININDKHFNRKN